MKNRVDFWWWMFVGFVAAQMAELMYHSSVWTFGGPTFVPLVCAMLSLAVADILVALDDNRK